MQRIREIKSVTYHNGCFMHAMIGECIYNNSAEEYYIHSPVINIIWENNVVTIYLDNNTIVQAFDVKEVVYAPKE